jgi:hypothetical protein
MRGSFATVMAVLVLTVFTAVAHGVVAGRWTGGQDAKPVMPEIPKTIGEWVGSDDDTDIDDPGLAHLTRKYTHSRTGRWFLMSLTVGHPGLTAVHTPEYCYRGSGYDQVGPIARRAFDAKAGTPTTFWTTDFEKKSAAGTEQLRVFWSWSAGQGWDTPDWPRWRYIGKPLLYKLYVVSGGQSNASGKDPALDEFVSALLGVLSQSLFASPQSPVNPVLP